MLRNAMLFCAVIFLSDRPRPNTNIMDEKEQIWQAVRAWNTAFEQNDAEGFFRHMHEDVSLFLPTYPYRIEGKEPDRKGYDFGLATGHSRVAFFQEMQPVIAVYGDAALVTYHTRGWYGPPGTEQLANLKETNVLAKQSGVWKVVHVHISK